MSYHQRRYRRESFGYGALKISHPHSKQPHVRVPDDTGTFSRENTSYRQRRIRQESYGYGASKMNHPKQPRRVPDDTRSWRSLPAWEKRFCEEVGGMPWERFVKAKNKLYKTDKVFDWDDSAGLEAFNEAKQRFWEEHHGFPCKKRLPSADLYIDNIDWNLNTDPILSSEIKSLTDDEKAAEGVKELDWFSIPLDQIKATGWDDCGNTGLPEFVGH